MKFTNKILLLLGLLIVILVCLNFSNLKTILIKKEKFTTGEKYYQINITNALGFDSKYPELKQNATIGIPIVKDIDPR